jgi:hypothetical protein
MINNNSLREQFKKIMNIKKVFINAKRDDWISFLNEIYDLDKNILKKIKDNYQNDSKVNKIRYDIIKTEYKYMDSYTHPDSYY